MVNEIYRDGKIIWARSTMEEQEAEISVRVSLWEKHGKKRAYINDAKTRETIGYYDFATDEIVSQKSYRWTTNFAADVLDALGVSIDEIRALESKATLTGADIIQKIALGETPSSEDLDKFVKGLLE